MRCDKTAQVHAYYDSELSPAQRAEMKSHLEQCGDCSALLAELKQLSERIASAPMADVPVETMARFQKTWRRVGDRGVLRMAGWLTAAAAAVLFGAMMIDHRVVDEGMLGTGWQTAAVMPPGEDYGGELVTVAQWMASDLAPDFTTDRPNRGKPMTKLVVIFGFAVAFAAGLMVGRQSGPVESSSASPTTRKSHRSFLVSELGLTSAQQQAMDKIWSETARHGKSEQDDRRRQLRRERDEAIAALVQPQDYDKYDQILKSYNDQSAAMDREMRKNFDLAVARTKELLTSEQQIKYDDFLSRHQSDRGRDRARERERENPRRPDASATSRPTS